MSNEEVETVETVEGDEQSPSVVDELGSVDYWRDLAQRAQAEFENTRKRLETRHLDEVKRAGAKMVEAIIPALDDIDYALAHAADAGDDNETIQGLAAIRTKLMSGLTSQGVEVIDPMGESFDAEVAQAVGMLPSADVEPDTVVQVLQKGYRLGGKLLRPAMVMVSTAG